MTDEEYKELVRQNVHHSVDYANILSRSKYESIHHHVWLQLMGLMETWDMI